MNFLSAILIVGLAVVAVSGAELKARLNGRVESLEKRDATPPSCASCVLPTNLNLTGAVDLAKGLGPAFEELATLIGSVVSGVVTNADDLAQAGTDALTSLRDGIGPVFDKISAAVENVVTCPALKRFFINMENNSIAVLTSLLESWPTLLFTPDAGTFVFAVSKALALASPEIVQLLRDCTADLTTIVQFPGLNAVTCPLFVTAIWRIFDPSTNGPVTALLIMLFNGLNDGQSGPSLTDVINNVLALFNLPPTSIPGLSDISIFQLGKNFICWILVTLAISEFTGLCPE